MVVKKCDHSVAKTSCYTLKIRLNVLATKRTRKIEKIIYLIGCDFTFPFYLITTENNNNKLSIKLLGTKYSTVMWC